MNAPDGDHSLAVFVFLFVNIYVRTRHILNGCDIAATSAHNPRHHRGWDRKFL